MKNEIMLLDYAKPEKLWIKTAKKFVICNNMQISTYSRHETGRRELKLAVAQGYYINLLHININWLLTGTYT